MYDPHVHQSGDTGRGVRGEIEGVRWVKAQGRPEAAVSIVASCCKPGSEPADSGHLC